MTVHLKRYGRFTGSYLVAGVLGGVGYWVLETIMHHFVFPDHDSLISDLYLMEPNELWMRVITVFLFVCIGAYAEFASARQARTEAELKESRAMYRTFAEAARDSVFIIDRGFAVRYVNGSGSAFLGRDASDVRGRTIEELFPPDSAVRMKKNVESVFDTAEPVVEASSFFVGGREFWLDTSLVPLRGVEGEVSGVLGVSRDVTGMKEYERHLKAERDRARGYLDVAGVMILALDNAGRVTLINRAGAGIIGLAEEDVIGRDWFSEFIPADVAEETRSIFKKIVSGDVTSFEYFENPIVCADGTEKLIAWRNAVLPAPDGSVIGTLSSGEDITERRRMDAALAERLDELERFREVTVKREIRIRELKDRVRELESSAGDIHGPA